jgi:tRNA nucleotidyltransferase/poly(A) polymerase
MNSVAAIMRQIADLARAHGLPRPFIVGGAVRNMILGTKPVDYDITCGSPDNLVLADLASQLFSVPTYETGVGAKKMTVDGIELDFSPHMLYVDLAEGPFASELYSRDFTINTMMIACDNGEFVDRCGGLDDLRAKMLRCPVSPAVSFKDPTRLLRAIKCIADGMTLDPAVESELLSQFHRVSGINHRHAGRMINDAIRINPDVIEWMLDKGLVKHIPMTKLVVRELARKRMLHHV